MRLGDVRGGRRRRVSTERRPSCPPGRRSAREYTHFVRNGAIALIDRFEIDSTEATGDGRVRAIGRRKGQTTTIEADTIVGATGYRPDLAHAPRDPALT